MIDDSMDRPRRRDSDTLGGQIRRFWPVLAAVAAGAFAWSGVQTKTYENASEIKDVKKDVDTLKQVMAAQTAIMTRVETSLANIEKRLRRMNREDVLP